MKLVISVGPGWWHFSWVVKHGSNKPLEMWATPAGRYQFRETVPLTQRSSPPLVCLHAPAPCSSIAPAFSVPPHTWCKLGWQVFPKPTESNISNAPTPQTTPSLLHSTLAPNYHRQLYLRSSKVQSTHSTKTTNNLLNHQNAVQHRRPCPHRLRGHRCCPERHQRVCLSPLGMVNTGS